MGRALDTCCIRHVLAPLAESGAHANWSILAAFLGLGFQCQLQKLKLVWNSWWVLFGSSWAQSHSKQPV